MEQLDRKKFIFGSLFLLANKLQAYGDQHLGPDMTTKQWLLTVMISQFQDHAPTLSEVAELMGSSRQNVKQLALKLEEKEFLRMEKDAADARATRLRLTPKSEAFWEQRQEKDNGFVLNLFKDFSHEEIDVLFKGVQKLFKEIENLERPKKWPKEAGQ